MKTFKQLAESAYKAYCKQAGGRSHDGKILPAFANIQPICQTSWEAYAVHIANTRLESITSELTADAYKVYWVQAGGVDYTGKLMRTFDQFTDSRRACWEAATRQIVAETAAVH